MLVSHFQTTGKYDRIDDVKCLPPLSMPCSSLIFKPPESMTEVMKWNVYPPKHSMLVSHFQTTGKYDRSHVKKCIPTYTFHARLSFSLHLKVWQNCREPGPNSECVLFYLTFNLKPTMSNSKNGFELVSRGSKTRFWSFLKPVQNHENP